MTLIIYAAVVLLLAWKDKSSKTVDSFIMGGRQAKWYGVGAAIFSLIGGGEIVALTALGFTFGFVAISLFAGYAIGFVVLGFASKKIRRVGREESFVSLPDFIHYKYGSFAGRLVFTCSLVAFFALLMIQFSAGGKLVSSLASISYEIAAISIGGLVTFYLVIGGFRTVIATDVLQGIARMALIPVLVGALIYANSSVLPSGALLEAMPTEVIMGLVLTGCFSALASADVWQRVYAASSDRSAKVGLLFGAFLMLSFGMLLVYIGMSAKAVAPHSVADYAFSTALSSGIPQWAGTTAIALVLISVLGTADTEIFVLASLIGREIGRRGAFKVSLLESRQPPTWARIVVVLVGALSTGAALLFSDVLEVYVWLICLLLAISPAVVASLIANVKGISISIGILINLWLFGALATVGEITADTAYYIVLPGFAFIFLLEIIFRYVLRRDS